MSETEILSPDELKASYQGCGSQGEYPAYSRAQWREAVASQQTDEGYWVWVHNSLCDEVAEADAEEDMDVSQVSYASSGSCTALNVDVPKIEILKAIPDVLRNRMYRLITEQLGVTLIEIREEKNYVTDFGADSLDQLELVMAVEEEFELELPDSDVEGIQTVGQTLELIASMDWR